MLDLYYPEDSVGFATIVYFQGGGLSGGDLHPRVENPTYTEDAAAAVAWVMQHVSDYGGDPKRIYVSGHSAGGYLASMVGLDTTYLAPYGLHPDSIAGLIPLQRPCDHSLHAAAGKGP